MGRFEVSGENKEWLSRSAVASAINIHSFPNLQDYFLAEDALSIAVRSMGGNSSLLTFESVECMEAFLKEKNGNKLDEFISIDGTTQSKAKFDSALLLIGSDSQEFVNKTIACDMGSARFHIVAIEEPGLDHLQLIRSDQNVSCSQLL
ncbi:hypothetical protein GH714_034581 [Hevea brasiliensis]|uniref:Uncharacterized protein n=1 Tax=Hevea brasiliensis TaxID=3981 RepID=A0A6A6M658_HEVBR|nr:hypothetical protein GH714_034581 [Hevea brasiliensis]